MVLKTAERIKELREKNDLTQTELAKRMNVTRSSVNAWEMGISIPSTEKIVELTFILHTTSDYILGINNDEFLSIYKYSSEEKELIYQMISYFDSRNQLY